MALPKAITNALNKKIYPSTMSHVSVLRCKYDGRIPFVIVYVGWRISK